MSWRHIEALVSLNDEALPPATARCVLVSLAHHANNYTGSCWPSVARLQKITGLGESTIRRSIDELVKLGFIHRTVTPGKVSKYLVMIEGAPTIDGHYPPEPKKAHPSRSGTTPLPEREDTPPAAGPERGIKEKKRLPQADAREGLADDWKPSDQLRAKIDAEYPTIDVDDQVRAFILKNRSMGTIHKDVDAAFEAWMHRIKDLRVPPKQRTPSSPARSPVGPADEAALMERRAGAMRFNPDEAADTYLDAARIWQRIGHLDDARRCAAEAAKCARAGSWYAEQAEQLQQELGHGTAT